MTLILHHAPLACSLAGRFALIESGLPHEVRFVRTWAGENTTPEYLAINPRGKVPTLETDEGVLTEATAILPYIADLAPEKALFPSAGSFARAVGQSRLSYLSSTVHAAFSPVFAPLPGLDTPAAKEAVMGRLVDILVALDADLAGREFMLDVFSVCDLYLAVFGLWRGGPQLAGRLPSLPNIDRVQGGVLARPGLMMAVAEEAKLRAATS